jgi:hypothetical protein
MGTLASATDYSSALADTYGGRWQLILVNVDDVSRGVS